MTGKGNVPCALLRVIRTQLLRLCPLLSLSGLLVLASVGDGGWLKKIPRKDHERVNPYSGQTERIQGGAKLFADHCAECHGSEGMGDSKHPSLRTDRIQKEATDGDLFWLLRNGNVGRGMPNWSAIPEPSRWQIVAFVKSLGSAPAAATGADASEEKTK